MIDKNSSLHWVFSLTSSEPITFGDFSSCSLVVLNAAGVGIGRDAMNI